MTLYTKTKHTYIAERLSPPALGRENPLTLNDVATAHAAGDWPPQRRAVCVCVCVSE